MATARQAADVVVFDALADVYLSLLKAVAVSDGVAFGDEGEYVWGVTPMTRPAFNRVMRVRLASADQVPQVAARYAPGAAWSWWLDALATPPDLAGLLVERGHRDAGIAFAMAMDLADLPALELPHGLRIERVRDQRSLVVAQRVAAAAIGAPEALGDAMAAYRAPAVANPDGPVALVLATLDGRPVSTAMVVVAASGDVAGLYTVTTLPDARGRGLGRAVSIAALQIARGRGARLGVLESSDDGHKLYLGIGFRDVGPIQVLVRDAGERQTRA